MHISIPVHYDQSNISFKRSISDFKGFQEAWRVFFRRRLKNPETEKKEVAIGIFG
jgi:hypothetical protein